MGYIVVLGIMALIAVVSMVVSGEWKTEDVRRNDTHSAMSCPKCGAILNGRARQCGSCGLKWHRCPGCNKEWQRGSERCYSCGISLQEVAKRSPISAPDQHTSPAKGRKRHGSATPPPGWKRQEDKGRYKGSMKLENALLITSSVGIGNRAQVTARKFKMGRRPKEGGRVLICKEAPADTFFTKEAGVLGVATMDDVASRVAGGVVLTPAGEVSVENIGIALSGVLAHEIEEGDVLYVL